jgi:predicted  nucleic acid-binding Zn-ribbon protein
MDGMSMMLKSFGIDPEQIKASLTAARDEIMTQVKELRDAQKEILESQKRIEEMAARIDMYFQSHSEVQGAIEGVAILPPQIPKSLNGG